MITCSKKSYADVILNSDYVLLKPYYINELEMIYRGVPYGACVLSKSIGNKDFALNLFNVVSYYKEFPYFKNKYSVFQVSERDSIFNCAIKNHNERKFRSAIRLYGILLFTSLNYDEFFFRSADGIRSINNSHYGI